MVLRAVTGGEKGGLGRVGKLMQPEEERRESIEGAGLMVFRENNVEIQREFT